MSLNSNVCTIMQLPCIILQYNIRGLLDAASNNRINDVKKHLHNKVNVNGKSIVSWLLLCFLNNFVCGVYVCFYLCMYVCMYMYVCRYVCMYVCMHVYIIYVTIPLQNIFAVKKARPRNYKYQ